MPKTRTKIELDVRLDDLARIKRHAVASRCCPQDYLLKCADWIMDAIENGSLEEGRFGFPRRVAVPVPARTAPPPPRPQRRRLNPTGPWTAEKDSLFERLYHEGKTYAEISKALRANGCPKNRAGRLPFSEGVLSQRAKNRGFARRGKGWRPAPSKPTISLEDLTASMQASGVTLNDVRDAAKSFKG